MKGSYLILCLDLSGETYSSRYVAGIKDRFPSHSTFLSGQNRD